MSLAVLPVLFTAEERPRAIAAVGGATFLGYPVGPILGGWLLDHFWWGSVFLINVPVVVIAIVAVITLMPESRGTDTFGVDKVGIGISSAGLALLTYGLIKAGNDGWGDGAAIAAMAAGLAALAAFAWWERRISLRPAGSGTLPLVDLKLFGSAGFTWGTVLATLVSFALFGLVFAMPQYFLDVRGLNSLGAGIRMLPMIAGLAVGLVIGQRLQTPRKRGSRSPSRACAGSDARAEVTPTPPALTSAPPVSPKMLVAGGFLTMAVALALGTRTTVSTSPGFAASWFAVTGFGLGLAMPTALNVALAALSPARSGSGSALITAMRQVGGTIGVAVLGTVLATVYQSSLHLAGLPASAVAVIRHSVASGVAAARAAGSSTVLDVVRGAYVHGLDVMLWVCAGIAITSAVLALLFLPRWSDAPTSASALDTDQDAVATPMG